MVSTENGVALWVPLVPLFKAITFATLLVELVVKGGVPRGTEGHRTIQAGRCPQYPMHTKTRRKHPPDPVPPVPLQMENRRGAPSTPRTPELAR